MHTTLKIAAFSCLALALAACGSAKDANEGNFENAIQAYLDTQKGLCVEVPTRKLPFTLENSDKPNRQNKQADALVEAGLLVKHAADVKPKSWSKVKSASEYQVTDLGKKYLVTGESTGFFAEAGFCTGKYTIVGIDNFTEPSDILGAKMSQVNFRYKVKEPADWANSESLQSAYGEFAKKIKNDTPDKAVLVLTNEGWMHKALL
ncbi:hypothetical protein [Pseudomonas citronellolis]|uniref:hypothetical protein n=1 Tax=Pseudomonas TaxID=286 RepID=UPI00209C8707|nr:hypothetical protein [Pseudomonas citronellolis]MCP1605858.1 hypothetical protein [Pseudomonas citronellolis]MCP1644655.1 hypothetical protein [Pseudomonas citronellolis]MCP1656429.1 hypothetical protein [Pseudomonas citronellolis]MCP1667748.1 hypothetical protein [Pseudomonas citronellolis]MCP1698809.1 hypothetical protein [Pseudomonas citronellolis]